MNEEDEDILKQPKYENWMKERNINTYFESIGQNITKDVKINDRYSSSGIDPFMQESIQGLSIFSNYERMRDRNQKFKYDEELMNIFIEELYYKISMRTDLFLIAFSQPIKNNAMDVLEILSSHQNPTFMENQENWVLTDSLYSKFI